MSDDYTQAMTQTEQDRHYDRGIYGGWVDMDCCGYGLPNAAEAYAKEKDIQAAYMRGYAVGMEERRQGKPCSSRF